MAQHEQAAVEERALEKQIRQELTHLDQHDVVTLARIVRRLVEAYGPERIYLFGSKARGDAGPDSDFDLMVLVSQTAERDSPQVQRAHRLLWEGGAAADILVWTQARFESRAYLRASLPATILREGRLRYAA